MNLEHFEDFRCEIMQNMTILPNYLLAVAAGEVDGASVVQKFGRTPILSAGASIESVWEHGGIYTGQPTGAAETMEIVSSSTADDIAGTGARTVHISQLIDENGKRADDVVLDLAGTTPVSLGALKYTRATRIKVLTAGTGLGNAGVLTLRHTTTTTNIFATVAIGKNQTNITAFTVPKGKTLIVYRAIAMISRTSGSLGSAEMQMRVRPFGGVYNMARNPEITTSQSHELVTKGFLVVPERTDMLMNVADISDNGSTIVGEFDGILIDYVL